MESLRQRELSAKAQGRTELGGSFQEQKRGLSQKVSGNQMN